MKKPTIINLKAIKSIEPNLKSILNDKKIRADVEERIKKGIFSTLHDKNSDDYDVEIKYNKMSKTMDIILKKADNAI